MPSNHQYYSSYRHCIFGKQQNIRSLCLRDLKCWYEYDLYLCQKEDDTYICHFNYLKIAIKYVKNTHCLSSGLTLEFT